jgi:hypothetical protein
LVNPSNPNAESDIEHVQAAARLVGMQIVQIDALFQGVGIVAVLYYARW